MGISNVHPTLGKFKKSRRERAHSLPGADGGEQTWIAAMTAGSLRRVRSEEKIASNSISLSGCGFLGVYHLGVACALQICAPALVQSGHFYGCSMGALMSACLLCNCDFKDCAEVVLELAQEVRKRTLNILSPNLNMRDYVKKCLERMLPEDAHEMVQGRFHVSVTPATYIGWTNFGISEFSSKKELVEALLCSCHVPYASSLKCPSFKGRKYFDGSVSCNNPVRDERTILVSPFNGEADICRPLQTSRSSRCVLLANTSLEVSKENFQRLTRVFFPPPPEQLLEKMIEGFVDAMNYYGQKAETPCPEHSDRQQGLATCPRCLGMVNPELYQQYFVRASEVFHKYIEIYNEDRGTMQFKLRRTVKNYVLKPVGNTVLSTGAYFSNTALQVHDTFRGPIGVLKKLWSFPISIAKYVFCGRDQAKPTKMDADGDAGSSDEHAADCSSCSPGAAPESPETLNDEQLRPFFIYLGDEPPASLRAIHQNFRQNAGGPPVRMYLGSSSSSSSDSDDEFLDVEQSEEEDAAVATTDADDQFFLPQDEDLEDANVSSVETRQAFHSPPCHPALDAEPSPATPTSPLHGSCSAPCALATTSLYADCYESMATVTVSHCMQESIEYFPAITASHHGGGSNEPCAAATTSLDADDCTESFSATTTSRHGGDSSEPSASSVPSRGHSEPSTSSIPSRGHSEPSASSIPSRGHSEPSTSSVPSRSHSEPSASSIPSRGHSGDLPFKELAGADASVRSRWESRWEAASDAAEETGPSGQKSDSEFQPSLVTFSGSPGTGGAGATATVRALMWSDRQLELM